MTDESVRPHRADGRAPTDALAQADWAPGTFPVEFYTLGSVGTGTPAGVILRESSASGHRGRTPSSGSRLLRRRTSCVSPRTGAALSALELPSVQDRPPLFSTFLMGLLADLFSELPEIGDVDKPRQVFFFGEAHLLFAEASKDFLTQVIQTVRLIRSKGLPEL